MANVVIELNSAGVRELLKSPEMAALLKEHADAIAGRCGAGYASDTMVMETRVIASAYAESEDARKDNLENNTLLRALQ